MDSLREPRDITGHEIETVKGWLESGSVDASDIADLPWYVESHGSEALVAINPLVPVKLYIKLIREAGILRIIAPTGVYTADLEPGRKLRLYRHLLRRNLMPLAKTVVDYEDGEIEILADLSTVSISEEEFNKALANVLSLVLDVYREVGVPREKGREAVKNLALFIENWHKKGMNEQDLVRLLEKAGMKPDEAKKLVEAVIAGGGRHGEEQGESLHI